MSKYKNFDINRAEKLRSVYKKKRNYAKERFISKLITYQQFFRDSSIVGVELSTIEYYRKNTVEAVLSDLNYKLISFSNPENTGPNGGKKTHFSFVPKNSDFAEGD